MVLLGPVGIGAGSLGDDQVIQVDVLLDGPGGAHPDNVLHAVAIVKLVGINADGGHTHARGHDGDLHTLVGAGIALDAPDIVYKNGVFQEVFGNEPGPQRVAGHQYRLGDDALLRCDAGRGRF